MHYVLTALWSLIVAGASATSLGFLFKTFVKSGIDRAVKLNFDKHLEDYRCQLRQEIEYLKASLRNAETFFVRQLQALTRLRRIFRGILPKPSTPYADWSDACEDIAHSFSEHADAIDKFLGTYGAVLPHDVLDKLERAVTLANEGTFFAFGKTGAGEVEPTDHGITMANDFYDLINSAVQSLQQLVDLQVTGRAREKPEAVAV